ncbi:protein of unknown function [Moritella yayanosii]|uniref:Uncharacterized protein n=1 Tax=Moritella yayanosii TaxID=69539 RepID=A0A330LP10_9GAMM|nr:protein of unknown function [Moritella yayanosii]
MIAIWGWFLSDLDQFFDLINPKWLYFGGCVVEISFMLFLAVRYR